MGGEQVSFGSCGKCGEDVLWRYYERTGKYSPPLEETGESAMVLTQAVLFPHESVEYGLVVQAHTCDRELKEAHQRRKREMEQRWAANYKLVGLAWKNAMPQACPKCRVRPYVRCKNLSKGSKRGTDTKWPHSERYTEEFRQRMEMDQDGGQQRDDEPKRQGKRGIQTSPKAVDSGHVRGRGDLPVQHMSGDPDLPDADGGSLPPPWD